MFVDAAIGDLPHEMDSKSSGAHVSKVAGCDRIDLALLALILDLHSKKPSRRFQKADRDPDAFIRASGVGVPYHVGQRLVNRQGQMTTFDLIESEPFGHGDHHRSHRSQQIRSAEDLESDRRTRFLFHQDPFPMGRGGVS